MFLNFLVSDVDVPHNSKLMFLLFCPALNKFYEPQQNTSISSFDNDPHITSTFDSPGMVNELSNVTGSDILWYNFDFGYDYE